jgi:hypothetical protein
MKARSGIALAMMAVGVLHSGPLTRAETYNLMPQPAQIAPGTGRLVINAQVFWQRIAESRTSAHEKW